MIDLHTHSNTSDGSDSPSELILKAAHLGVSIVSLTDHDSIDGLVEAEIEASKHNIKFLPGIELSVAFGDNRLIHILGIGIDYKNKDFLQIYQGYRQKRSEKLAYVMGVLADKGIPITDEKLQPTIVGGLRDRQAIVKWLVNNGFAPNITKGWNDFLDPIPYEEGELITPEQALKMIKIGGGKSFLAHYTKWIGFEGYDDLTCRTHFTQLKKLGLDGLECYYPTFTVEDTQKAESYADDFNLLKCGGTDYHGRNRIGIELGRGSGNFKVETESILRWIDESR